LHDVTLFSNYIYIGSHKLTSFGLSSFLSDRCSCKFHKQKLVFMSVFMQLYENFLRKKRSNFFISPAPLKRLTIENEFHAWSR